MDLFWLSSRYVTIIGLIFDFIGGILLASEIIGLLEIIERKNLKIREKINSIKSEKSDNTSLIIFILKNYFGIKISFKEFIYIIWLIYFLSPLSGMLLFFLQLANKIPTKRGIGLLGVTFLCIGFILQIIGNL